jgi:predicted amidohydrolase
MPLRVAACQLPDVRDDVPQTLAMIEACAAHSQRAGVRLVCFPEAFLQGYSADPRHVAATAIDLASSAFRRMLARLDSLAPLLVLGLIERDGNAFFNSAVVIQRGVLVGRYRKVHLLKGESSTFAPGDGYPVFDVDGAKFGVNICYDLCFSESVAQIAAAGAGLVVCPCSNMMSAPKAEEWRHRHNAIRAERAREAGVWLLSADVTGERDGRISYGPTAVIDPSGAVVDQVPLETTGMVIAEIRELRRVAGRC